MSMSVQEGLLLDDGKAGVDVSEVDFDQFVAVRAYYSFNVGQGSRFVVRYRDFGIVVGGEILSAGHLAEEADLGLGLVCVVEIAQADQTGIQSGGLTDISAVTVPLKTERLVDDRENFGAGRLDGWCRGGDVGQIKDRLVYLL
jgi:hypothetical protein